MIKKKFKKDKRDNIDDLKNKLYEYNSILSKHSKIIRENESNDIKELQSIQFTKFSDLPLSSKTTQGLKSIGFDIMTKIQRESIIYGLLGRDIFGEAKTGSGKTLAYLIPVVENLFRMNWSYADGTGCIILAPTRELIVQIFQVLNSFGKYHSFSTACIFGGKNIEQEASRLYNINIIFATPGRLLQHLDESPLLDVSNVKILVVDEADQLVDMGFQNTMKDIISHLKTKDKYQTFLFSATLSRSVNDLALISLSNPYRISLIRSGKIPTPQRLSQFFVETQLHQQLNVLFNFLRKNSQKKIVVFLNSCKQVRFYYESFRILKPGCSVFELHGKQNQQKRLDVFAQFSIKDKSACLFCTDIAARGIDFPVLNWVIQLNCPNQIQTYLHRVGRTARYQNKGRSLIFLLPHEKQKFLELIEKEKISIKEIYWKNKKTIDVKSEIEGLLVKRIDLQYLAKRALVSYIRSVLLQDKSNTNTLNELFENNIESNMNLFAQSYGLLSFPKEYFDEFQNLSKRKKMTKLEKLKYKISLKKIENRSENEKTDSDSEEDLSESSTKVVSKALQRAKRIQILRQSKHENEKSLFHEDKDDFLVSVDDNSNQHHSDELVKNKMLFDIEVQKKLKKQRIRIRADGTAKIKGLSMLTATPKNIVFNDSDDDYNDGINKDIASSQNQSHRLLDVEALKEKSSPCEDTSSLTLDKSFNYSVDKKEPYISYERHESIIESIRKSKMMNQSTSMESSRQSLKHNETQNDISHTDTKDIIMKDNRSDQFNFSENSNVNNGLKYVNNLEYEALRLMQPLK